VGDIHGRHDLLDAMVDRIDRDRARFEDGRQAVTVFLGDYIDRGDHSREVIDKLLVLEYTREDVVFLKGNHEAALLDFLEDPGRGVDWLGYGGLQTLASYGVAPVGRGAGGAELERTALELGAAMGPHIGFLERTRHSFRSGDVICAHAGIDPDRSPEDQGEGALLWGRSAFLDDGGVPGLRVVHGHWAEDAPVVTPRRICVDTGAYYSGRLTAVRLDAGQELLHVDALMLD
jgi:serine/threonine protein phosphatase 1